MHLLNHKNNNKIMFSAQREKPIEVWRHREPPKVFFLCVCWLFTTCTCVHCTHSLALSMCNFSQPQKQTDLQTHNEWITFTSFHFLWTLKCFYSINVLYTHWALFQLLYKWIATLATNHPLVFAFNASTFIFNGNEILCICISQNCSHPLPLL